MRNAEPEVSRAHAVRTLLAAEPRPNTQYWFRVLSVKTVGDAISEVIAVRTNR